VRIGSKHPNNPSGDRTRWVQWRLRRLLSAGFPADIAQGLAREERVDLHALLELVDRGCPPDLAARILAPLEDGPEQS
jgi:hypothetical protein